MSAKSRKRAAPDVVCEGLRRAILSGELAQGVQLRQDQLAEQFGTSRIPVREALRQLEAEGLVLIKPNRGASVMPLSLADVLEMLEIRIALECHALRLAIPQMVEDDFTLVEQILRSYDEQSDPQHWAQMNQQFHWALYTPCQKPRLLALIEANGKHADRFVRGQVSRATGKERPQKEHYQLLELCRQGQTDSACALLALHIEQTKKSVQASQRHPAAPS